MIKIIALVDKDVTVNMLKDFFKNEKNEVKKTIERLEKKKISAMK